MFNPFFMMIYTSIVVLVLYAFGWSDIFPKLSASLFLFIIFIIVQSLFLGVYLYKKRVFRFYNAPYKSKYKWLVLLIWLGYLFEFIIVGDVPLLSLFRGSGTSYTDFGIPTFHVILVTFNSFFLVYLFHVYLSTKSKFVLYLVIISVIPSILIVSRGLLILNVISCFFVYLLKIERLKLKNIFVLLFSLVIASYLFGLFGNIRTNNMYRNGLSMLDSTVILQVGAANERFSKTGIPDPYFWTYIYITSPTANLQTNINYQGNQQVSINAFSEFVVTELTPDFLSKRMSKLFKMDYRQTLFAEKGLNVSTAYSRGYMILNWLGPILFYLYLSILSFLYLVFLRHKKSAYLLSSTAIISTMFILSFFINSLAFSGISFQLVYPVLFSIFERKNK